MKQKLVLAGGGHAHMMTLAHLHQFVDRGHEVIVIQPSEHHYYSGMGPGMLGGTYTSNEIRFATRRQVEKKGGTFVLGKVAKIDAGTQRVLLESGKAVAYDVLSCNLGSFVPRDMITGDSNDIYTVKPIESLQDARERVLDLASRKKITIGIVGGGPSAVEIAGNLRRLTARSGLHAAHIKIITGTTIIPRHPSGVRKRTLNALDKQSIEIVKHCQVVGIRTGCVTEASGKCHELDIVFVAVGVKPSQVFQASGIPTGPDGGLLVNRYLQSTAHGNIFGGGDCIYFQEAPLDKVGVYAVRENPVLFHNLMAAMNGGELQSFTAQTTYLLIFNLGNGTGIFYKKPILFGGRVAFRIKDYIDRKFMRKFQEQK
jgi:NADH dehydrogenase FAD-containing subunit